MDARLKRDNLRRFALRIKDASPVASRGEFWRTASQAAAIGVFLILFLAALNLGRSLLLPVALAIFRGMLRAPLTARESRYNIPPVISAIVLVLLFIGII